MRSSKREVSKIRRLHSEGGKWPRESWGRSSLSLIIHAPLISRIGREPSARALDPFCSDPARRPYSLVPRGLRILRPQTDVLEGRFGRLFRRRFVTGRALVMLAGSSAVVVLQRALNIERMGIVALGQIAVCH